MEPSGTSDTAEHTLPGRPQRRRWLTALPFTALVVVLGISVWLALTRSNELDRTQTETDVAALQRFRGEIQSSAAQVGSEVDRITELIMGVRAYTLGSNETPVQATGDYLRESGAVGRFDGLTAAIVIDQQDIDNGPLAQIAEARDAQGVPVVRARIQDSQLLDDIRSRASGDVFLSTAVWQGRAQVAVSFALEASFMSGRNLGWVSLLFDETAFLRRAIQPRGQVTHELTVNPPPTQDVPAAGEPEPGGWEDTVLATLPGGALSATQTLDVFGSPVALTSTTGPGFAGSTSNLQVMILLAAGGVAALGFYAALRALVRARATAIEAALTATQERAATDRRFRASFETSPNGMAEIDRLGRVVEVNEAMCTQIGRSRELVVGAPLSSMVHEPDRTSHLGRIESLLNGEGHSAQGEHRYRHTDGHEVWVSESISVIDIDDSGPQSMLVQSQDITAQRRAAWELARQALHDDLTGLPNRALFLNRLTHALDRCRRSGAVLAVMFIDIDRFKVINDSLGHEMGDVFLTEIAQRIAGALRTGDTVARFGGDEFVVLCEDVAGESEVLMVAHRIQAAFGTPFELGDTPTYATSSIGITLSTPETDCADSLLRDADAAMYRAKDGGRNRTELFDQSMRSTVVARMEIESQLRRALQNGEIVMHYMAIVDPITYQPAGYEALIRWNHPTKGLLGPGAFLSVAEEAGLIHLVDSFALRQTCHQIAEWLDRYPAARDLYMATNWSARHLGRFVQQVEQVLAETGVDPRHLVIEVTEGFLLEDSDGSLVALERLKDLGVRIAIDDFGTGYSSLAYLTRFDVDFLKIDQSFVSKLPGDPASAAVIGAIADMAHRLGIGLVAEGVETDEQILMLRELGSPKLQGYRFARPRPASDIEYQLERLSAAARRGADATASLVN